MRAAAVLLIAFTTLLAVLFPMSAQANLMISELCDPYYNYLTDRFIEIYNPDIDTIDLTGWSLVAVGNGTNIFTWNLSGQINPGQALVAGNLTTVTVFPVTFADDAWSTSNATWNGRVGDGAKLYAPGNVLVDIIVTTGTAFENSDYVRKPEILAPNTTYTPAEWTSTPVNLATDASPGTHNVVPPAPGPSILNIHTDPAAPVAASTVNVIADVTDTTATVTSVVALWGLSASALSNEISMPLVSGSTYETATPIPAQSEGSTVYFKVRATSDLPGTNTSTLQTYTLPFELTIYEIQGAAPASPYDGKSVITQGIVTALYGSYFVLQDGTGSWNGIWARGAAPPSVGDSITVRGRINENDSSANAGNTLLVDAVVMSSSPGAALPAAATVSSAVAASEAYEGVLCRVASAACTNRNLGYGEWEINDGSGAGRVDDLGYQFLATLGTSYEVTGPVIYSGGIFKVEPRDESDILWVADLAAPVIFYAAAINDTTVIVAFSEELGQASAETIGNYAIDAQTPERAVLDPIHPGQVRLTVQSMTEGGHALTVDGVADTHGNVAHGGSKSFTFEDNSVPAGYYASAEGLAGVDLKTALHDIIKNHTVCSYSYAWTAFYTTDDKPDGKVWDIYSDVPDGMTPYEYTFGVNQGGVGGVEGTGYNREHSFPKSWFGGDVSPMHSDLFILYPSDTYVNSNRANYAFGETSVPEWTSLNGTKRGPSSTPGYTGTVFEPLDEFKGDMARGYFYVSTRYYTEDAAWPDGPMTNGAELLPWAVDMLLQWHTQDPVSQKEIDRNGAVYRQQHNRNPFIDHPEFVARMFMTAGAGDAPALTFVLGQNSPNPFGSATTIGFALPRRADVDLVVYDIAGRLVRRLASGPYPPGQHQIGWDGLDAAGRSVESGIYFYRLQTPERTESRKLLRAR
jgi:endonuclease I